MVILNYRTTQSCPDHVRILLFYIISSLIATVPAAVQLPSSPTTDRLALLAFKSFITSDPNGILSSWGNETLPLCQWSGVTCASRLHPDRVIALHLNYANLTGHLSKQLSNLTFLTRLRLEANNLAGPIPSDIGRLSQLKNLNLSGNHLNGEIPISLTRCSNLRFVSLRDNLLTGEIPRKIGVLSRLQVLDLGINNLTGTIPSNFGGLSRLKYLSLKINQLNGEIPASLTRCSKLQVVNLRGNLLTGEIPCDIGALSRLKGLYADQNHLTGPIPSDIGRLSQLMHLNLSKNYITGEIPASLTRCSNLLYLSLQNNMLTGDIPRDIGALSRLQMLTLGANNLTGTIPPSMGNISSLWGLYLHENSLQGCIPSSMGKLSDMQILQLSSNKLSGVIPPLLFNLSLIQELSLSDNQLVGSLPPNMFDSLPALQTLLLWNNKLSGRIPISLTNASNMVTIQLESNFFTGTIPSNLGNLQYLRGMQFSGNRLEANEAGHWDFLTSLANCSQLEKLILSSNRLGGILPATVGNLSTNLQWLYMDGNQISGSIPDEIGNLVNLTVLSLDENRLTGAIPSTVGRLQQLHVLSLSMNQLTGQIPKSIGNLKQLIILYFGANNLNGTIPPSLGSLNMLNELDIAINKLTGSIPKELLTLSSLSSYFDLSDNLLTGSLPSEVGKLTSLNVLNISNNRLSGEIPSDLGSCQSLEYLNMHSNLFQGTIPRSLTNLEGLRELDLSSNNLSGEIPTFLGSLRGLLLLNLSFNNLEGQVPNEGVFRYASEVSLLGNNLCGGHPELRLPNCDSRSSNNGDHHTMIQLVASVLAIALGLIMIFVICRMKKIQMKSPFTPIESQFTKVSYAELLKSTDGFSASNLIGVGSFGSVYKGTMSASNSIVAVKVLNLQRRGAEKSFLTECKALKAIRHRNLLKILTVCFSVDFKGGDFRALVLEFMPNGSLEKWLHSAASEGLEKPTLSLVQRLNIAIDVASALEYLHHHGQTPIVHCDLKPNNVLLDNDMCAHVGDFGLARFLSVNTEESQSMSTGIKGTVGYVPPEYGMGCQASTNGDVYSYGILLLELFTGKRPTEDMFTDLSLCNYVEMLFPERIMEIIDARMLLLEGDQETQGEKADKYRAVEWECLVSVIGIGLSCTKEDPRARMETRDITKELFAVRNGLLKSENT